MKQTLYVDVFFWRERPYFLCVAKPLCLVITRNIPRTAMNEAGYQAALEWTTTHIKQRGFSVGNILRDGDRLLGPLAAGVAET